MKRLLLTLLLSTQAHAMSCGEADALVYKAGLKHHVKTNPKPTDPAENADEVCGFIATENPTNLEARACLVHAQCNNEAE